MPPGPSLCSFKQALDIDLEGALQWSGKALQRGETTTILQKYLYWLKLQQDVSRFIRQCTTYAIVKPTIKKSRLYDPLPTPDKYGESNSMDYMSSLPSTKHGNNYVFVVVVGSIR